MSYQITLSPSGHKFSCQEGQEILKAGLAAGLRMPFSCRSGMCRTCRGRVIQGTVDFGVAHIKYLSDAERSQGLALLCCASPTSNVVIELDEIDPHKHMKPQRMPSRVLSFSQAAPDVRIVTLGLPANEPMQFRAGQFVDVLLDSNTRRSYSIANPPRSEGVRQLELHIHHMSGGKFTDHIFIALKAREIWQIEMPLGSFCLQEESDKPIIFVATGTGFAPIKSMIQALLGQASKRPMHLFWGGRYLSDLYQLDVVQGWARDNSQLHFTPVLSQDSTWSGRRGYVQQAVLRDYPDLSRFEVYACGSAAMVETAGHAFQTYGGLPPEAFQSDVFLSEADRHLQEVTLTDI
jgi:CDP-4-dehydro-6-deoxyglucose reductase